MTCPFFHLLFIKTLLFSSLPSPILFFSGLYSLHNFNFFSLSFLRFSIPLLRNQRAQAFFGTFFLSLIFFYILRSFMRGLLLFGSSFSFSMWICNVGSVSLVWLLRNLRKRREIKI